MQSFVFDMLGEVKGRARCRISKVRSNQMFVQRLMKAETIVAESFGVAREDFYRVSRGPKRVADARQVMMYFAHVTFGFTLGEVGRLYNRDRSTVGYACRKFEDLRDNPKHDQMLDQFEREICAGVGAGLAPVQLVAVAQAGGGA